MAEWRQQMTRIAQLVEAWTPNDAAATVDAVRELSTLLGSTDCAVGFAAKEALHRVLCGSSPPNQVDAAQIVRCVTLLLLRPGRTSSFLLIVLCIAGYSVRPTVQIPQVFDLHFSVRC